VSEPVIEQIAQWLLTALQGMTPEAGYYYALKVSRPLTLEATLDTDDDLCAILALEDREFGADRVLGKWDWLQRFSLTVTFLKSAEPDVGLDTRVNRVAADVEMLLGAELVAHPGRALKCGGLAQNVFIPEIIIWEDPQKHVTRASIIIAVEYKTSIGEPAPTPPAAAEAFSLDVDGNGVCDAMTDGLLIMRYLMGARGDTLIEGAIGAGATRTTAEEIEAYLSPCLLS